MGTSGHALYCSLLRCRVTLDSRFHRRLLCGPTHSKDDPRPLLAQRNCPLLRSLLTSTKATDCSAWCKSRPWTRTTIHCQNRNDFRDALSSTQYGRRTHGQLAPVYGSIITESLFGHFDDTVFCFHSASSLFPGHANARWTSLPSLDSRLPRRIAEARLLPDDIPLRDLPIPSTVNHSNPPFKSTW